MRYTFFAYCIIGRKSRLSRRLVKFIKQQKKKVYNIDDSGIILSEYVIFFVEQRREAQQFISQLFYYKLKNNFLHIEYIFIYLFIFFWFLFVNCARVTFSWWDVARLIEANEVHYAERVNFNWEMRLSISVAGSAGKLWRQQSRRGSHAEVRPRR